MLFTSRCIRYLIPLSTELRERWLESLYFRDSHTSCWNSRAPLGTMRTRERFQFTAICIELVTITLSATVALYVDVIPANSMFYREIMRKLALRTCEKEPDAVQHKVPSNDERASTQDSDWSSFPSATDEADIWDSGGSD
jgi:hypothetical protein